MSRAESDRPPPLWRLAPAVDGWLVAGVALLLLGLLTRRTDIAVLGSPFLLGVAWTVGRRPRRTSRVELVACDQPAGSAGVTAEVEITPAPGSALVTVRVGAPGHRPSEALLSAPRARGQFSRTTRSVPVAMRSVRTGRRQLFRLDYREANADQLLSTAAQARPPIPITVLPGTRPLEELPLPFRLQGLTGPHGSRRAGDGGDLRDVGPFMAGDRLRRIDWRVTARMNTGGPLATRTSGGRPATVTQLYTRRTFATADATVMLVVDSRDEIGPRVVTWGDATSLREDEASSLDIARTAAASLARYYLANGDRVGLEDLGRLRRPVPPAGGRQQQLRLTQRLALAEPEGEPIQRKRVPRLPSGSLIIVFSTFLDDDASLMASTWRSAGHRVIAVDTLPPLLLTGANPRIEIAYRIIAMERTDRLRALERTGVELITWLQRAGPEPAVDLGLLARKRQRR